MKTFTQILGFIACLLFVSAFAFRVNRLPGNDLLFTIAGILISLYLPFGILEHKKSQLEKYSIDSLFLALSMLLISLGILFKIQHIPFGTLTLLIGEMIFCCLYLPLYLYRKIKTEGKALMFLSGALGLLMFPLGIYLRINAGFDWGFKLFLGAIPTVFFIFLPVYFLEYRKNPSSFKLSPEKLLFLMVIGVLIYFFVFRTVYPPK